MFKQIIIDNNILIIYSQRINKLICDSVNLDNNKLLKNPNSTFIVKNSDFKGVSLVIAIIITVIVKN